MESSPAMPNPFEGSSGSDKKSEKKKSSHTLRIPLHADALHGGESRKPEPSKAPEGILPIFPKREHAVEKPATPATEAPVNRPPSPFAEHAPKAEATPPAPVTEDAPRAHPDLEGLSHDLWQDFDTTKAAARQDKKETDEEEEDDDTDTPQAVWRTPERTPDTETVPEPGEWRETHTLHLNETPAAEQAPEEGLAMPSNAAMAAEVAATEPDPQSVDELERAYAVPAAKLPAEHPEAQAKPMPPMTEQQRFQDMMARAEFNDDFVRQASAPVPVQPHQEAGTTYYTPPAEVVPPEPTTPAETAPYIDPRQWYPQYYRPNHPMGPTVEGAVAGAVAGGAAGAMVGNRAPETPRAEQQSQQPTAYAQERPVSFGAAPYATEQAPQPVYMPQQERSAPITNEQRTVTPYTEQSRTPAPVVERPAPGAHPQEAALAPQPEAPVPVSAEADQQNREAENKIHTVESSWHRVQVENGTNRIVEGQPEGRALIEEKRAESNPRAASDDDNQDQQQDAAGAAGTSMYQQPLPGAVAPMIASGQIGYPRELASGQVDYEHRLDPPRNPVVTALASPLLWVGIVVLVLAFFAAAFL